MCKPYALLTSFLGCCTAASRSGGLREILTALIRSGRGVGSGIHDSIANGRGSCSSIGTQYTYRNGGVYV